MNAFETKLQDCFRAVFPSLPLEDIQRASLENVQEWDSITHLTLVETIQQEFSTRINDEEIDLLTSYDAWLERLQQPGGTR